MTEQTRCGALPDIGSVLACLFLRTTGRMHDHGTNTRDEQAFGTTFFLGKTVPGLKFTTPPANGAAIEASYQLELPFKTSNNLLRFTCSLLLSRGEGS